LIQTFESKTQFWQTRECICLSVSSECSPRPLPLSSFELNISLIVRDLDNCSGDHAATQHRDSVFHLLLSDPRGSKLEHLAETGFIHQLKQITFDCHGDSEWNRRDFVPRGESALGTTPIMAYDIFQYLYFLYRSGTPMAYSNDVINGCIKKLTIARGSDRCAKRRSSSLLPLLFA
jgi:hypothetical protein